MEREIFKDWQQEDELFVQTKASEKVESVIKKSNLVIVAGHSGSGKSAIIQHVALVLRKQGWVVKQINSIENIEASLSSEESTENTTLFVLNDPIGKEFLDDVAYSTWRTFEQSLTQFLKKVKLLVTCRNSILQDNKVKKLTHFQDSSNVINVDSGPFELNEYEKRKIFEKHNAKRQITKEDISEIVQTKTYFPLLCKLFSKTEDSIDHLVFFREPKKVLQNEIENLKVSNKEKYCGLVCLALFRNKLCSKEITENYKLFKECLLLCGVSECTSPATILNNLELVKGLFVKKIGETYHFYHDFVMEVTTFVFGTDFPSKIIEHADIGFLRRRVRLKDCADFPDSFIITLSDDWIESLSDRLFQEIFQHRFMEVILNPCLKNEKIIEAFIRKINLNPQKLHLMDEEMKIAPPEQSSVDTRKHMWCSRLNFVTGEKRLSPLFALIAFCHDVLSIFCLKALKQTDNISTNSRLFSAVCCTGSTEMFHMFSEQEVKDCLKKTWMSLYPVGILSLFHNFELLQYIFKLDMVNRPVAVDEDHVWTPLMLAMISDTSNIIQNDHDRQSRRNKTIQVLIDNGYSVNYCSETVGSALFLACEYGYDSTVDLLLNKGADANFCDRNGVSPLSKACLKGYDHISSLLLKSGADVNLCNEIGHSPLFVACENGLDKTVQLLLENGANVNLSDKDGVSPLFSTCKKGKENIVQLLLRYGADVNQCDKNDNSPLQRACFHNHINVVRLLMESGADVNLCNAYGDSPLSRACQYGYDSIVQFLIKNSANVNLCDNKRVSPLSKACLNGYDNIVQLLVKSGAKVNLCDQNEVSPLFNATFCTEETLSLLIQNGADVNKRDKNGDGPLHEACKKGREGTLQILLNNKVEVNQCNKNGYSPLYIACSKGHTKIVQRLLGNGAEVNLCDENKNSPLSKACENGHDAAVQFLLEYGADVNLCNTDGVSPISLACENGHDRKKQHVMKYDQQGELLTFETEHESIVELLVKSGADLNLCDNNRKSPLFKAYENGHNNIVKFLLTNGAEENLCTIDGVRLFST